MKTGFFYRTRILAIILVIANVFFINTAIAQVSLVSGNGWTHIGTNTAGGNPATQTTPYTINSGSNRLLVVGVEVSVNSPNAVPTTKTVTWGGMPLTFLSTNPNAGNRVFAYLYYLNESDIASASGNSLVVTMGGFTIYGFVTFAAVYENVNQSTPVMDGASLNCTATTFLTATQTANFTSGNQGIFLAGFGLNSATATAYSSTVSGWTGSSGLFAGNTGNGGAFYGGIGTRNGTGAATGETVSMTVTVAERTSMSIVSLVPIHTWDGGGANNNWTTAANWVGDVAPKAGDDLVFDATGVGARPSPNNDFTAGTSFGTITVAVGGYTIGGNSVSLTTGLTASNASGTSTVSLVVGGAGTVTKSGAGTLTLSGANTYTGVTTISAGTLSVGTIGNGGVAGNLGQATNAAGNLVLSGGTLQYTGASATTDRNFTLTAGTTSTIDISTAGTTLTLNGGAVATTGGLTKIGSGTLLFNAANLYTGTTTVNAGTLAVDGNQAKNRLASGAQVTINNGGTFEIRGLNALLASTPNQANFTVNSGGTLRIVSGTSTYGGTNSHSHVGNLTLAGGTVDLSYSGAGTSYNTQSVQIDGSVTVTANSTIQFGSGASNANAGIALKNTSFTVDPGVTLNVSAELENSDFGDSFSKNGTGTMVVSGTNTYTGTATINAGTLTLGASNSLPDAGTMTLNGGTFSSGATVGYNETINTLTLTDNSTISLGTGVHTITYAASNGISWTSGKILSVTGWTGSWNGTSGTSGKIFVGNSATGLTATQLSQILFDDGASYYPAAILASGEVVPTYKTITTGTIAGSPFCAGSAVSVPFTIGGTFVAGNVFTAQLSDGSGSFASPVSIGTLTSTVAGTINATIPAGTSTGTGYRIRVVGNSPVITGTNNGTDFTINAILPVSVSIVASANPACSDASVTFTATPTNGGTTPAYQWKLNGSNVGTNSNTYINPAPVNGDAVVCILTSNAPCISGNPATSNTINMSVTTKPVATFSYTGTPYYYPQPNPGPTFNGGGIAGTFSAAPAGLVFVSTATGQVDLAASAAGSYTVTNTIAASGGCGVVTADSPITILGELTWTGAVNTDWNVAGNWTYNILPVLTLNAVIPNVTNKPILSTGAIGAVKNITIENSSSLTVTGNTLQIAGTITNNGTFTAAAGTIEMKGSGAQVIAANLFAGNTIKDLTINNSSGVTLQGTLNVTGIVTASSGNLASGGYLTLVSSASQTALINGSGTGDVTGNVTMQRYLPIGYGYKYFSSPFQAATVNEFGDDMNLGAAFPTFYKYDQTLASSGWVNYTNTSGVLNPLEGYAVNFGPNLPPNTVDVTGVVNNGALSRTIYNNNNTYTSGFNLAGNPYPSAIDWDAGAGWTKTFIDNALYYYKASTTDQYGGVYSAYVNGVSSDGVANNIIPSMQGFFVHVSDGTYPVTGTLSLNNNVRITDLTHTFLKSAKINSGFLLRLKVSFTNDLLSTDPMVIYFNNNATSGFDSKFDALKLINTDLNVPNLYAFLPDGKKLSIDALPEIGDTDITVPMGLKTYKNGKISIGIKDIENIPVGMKIYLFDKSASIYQDLLSDKDYQINLNSGEYIDRFFIMFLNKTTGIPNINRSTSFFSVYSSDGILKANVDSLKNGEGNISIYDLVGHKVFIQRVFEKGYYELEPFVKTGIYIVSFTTGNIRQTKKIFILNK